MAPGTKSTPPLGPRPARRFGVSWNAGEPTGAIYAHSRYERNCDAVRRVNELRAAGFVAELDFVGGYEGARAYESAPLGSRTAAGLAAAV